MSAIENPPAFPGKRSVGGRSGPGTGGKWEALHAFDAGMTLRDWFAGQVIGHIVQADLTSGEQPAGAIRCVRAAYGTADEMLASRSEEASRG